jgi:hypothetical protein
MLHVETFKNISLLEFQSEILNEKKQLESLPKEDPDDGIRFVQVVALLL